MRDDFPCGFDEVLAGVLPGTEIEAFWRAMGAEPVRGLRLRPGMMLDMVSVALGGGFASVPWAEGAYYIGLDSPAGRHPLHEAGAYYLQEPSAMAAVAALDVRPGQRVLDLCAAPGGKSTQIGGLLRGQGVLVSNEIVPSRAKVLSQNVERMGVVNTVVTNEPPDRLAAKWGPWFDRVLVDAPCSGEGMFRRDANARGEWTPQSPAGCAARQQQVLESAAQLVLPGGLLVYSTCTFNAVENEGVVAAFLAAHDDFHREDFTLTGVGASQGGCLRLWPHRLAGEGHFVARLRRDGASTPAEPGGRVQLSGICEDFGTASAHGTLVQNGDRLWLAPAPLPDLQGIRVLRTGLALGEQRGKVFLPDHAVAMAFPPTDMARHFDLDDLGAIAYLRGETISAPEGARGWTSMAYRGLSLGWGKCVDGTLKNHLPKGLRKTYRL